MSRRWRRRLGLGLLAPLALTLAVCRPDDQRTDTVDPTRARSNLPAATVAQLDSGTAAFRAHDFEAALRHYRAATEISPEEAGGWFGVYMTQRALGNEAAADSALLRVREVAPGASLLHDTAGGA